MQFVCSIARCRRSTLTALVVRACHDSGKRRNGAGASTPASFRQTVGVVKAAVGKHRPHHGKLPQTGQMRKGIGNRPACPGRELTDASPTFGSLT